MSRAKSILNHNNMAFISENHGTTTEKASYFLNHVDLGVIELQALKKREKKSSNGGDDLAKIKKEIMYE